MAESKLLLFAWQDAARAAHRRRALRRRIGWIAGGAMLALGLAAIPHSHPALLWNASASVPVGLYAVTDPDGFEIGDLAVIWPPEPARGLADARHYLPRAVPILKPVAALSGDVVCADGAEISINGRFVVVRKATDGRGRPLPWWNGCRRLGDGQVFVLASEVPDSFDGRYFGVSDAHEVIGKAFPIRTW